VTQKQLGLVSAVMPRRLPFLYRDGVMLPQRGQ
jgi:hypothetical protein